MCRFLSADFEYALKCPVDHENHTVRFQAYPQLRGHALDVVECDGEISNRPAYLRQSLPWAARIRRVLAKNLSGVGDFRA
jgi:hypothetical protein